MAGRAAWHAAAVKLRERTLHVDSNNRRAGCRHCWGDKRGRESMRVFLRVVVLFCCLLAFVTGVVIAVASLLS